MKVLSQLEQNTKKIKQIASEIGFEECGIAQARKLDEDAARLETWLNNGRHGEMKYMENHFDLRVDQLKAEALLILHLF